MRRILLGLVGLAMFFGGTGVAMAHGPYHGGYRHGAPYYAGYRPYPRYRAAYGPGFVAGYAPGYVAPYAPGCGVGYGAGYGPGYIAPQAAIGFSTPGLSLWYGR